MQGIVSTAAGAGQVPGTEALVPGSRIGKYELICRLAIGGMAELYLARARGIEGFEKLVALKRILPQYAQNKEFIQMFIDEARLAASLSHQNIAQVYDIGQSGGAYFFTMEYVHGEDLRTIAKAALATRGLPLQHTLAVAIGVSAGLNYAHERRSPDGRPLGIVHRDISPSNVLVTYDGQVKVVDFGIAKATAQGVQTRSGTLKGKIAYMSPEQCKGLPLDRRSDVFAIGILLYELTTGRRLFTGDNEFAILHQIVSDDVPPPSTYKRDYPPALERIVMRALARVKDHRYPSAQELQVDLEQFAVEHRLVVSSVSLSRYMRELFGEKIDAWSEAQKKGRSLAEHIAAAATAITQTGEVSPEDAAELDATLSKPTSPSAAPAFAEPPPRSSGLRWALLALGIASAVAAGLGAYVIFGKDLREPPASTAPAVTAPAPAPDPTPAPPPPTPVEEPVVAQPAPPDAAPTEPVAATKPPKGHSKSTKKKKPTKSWDPDSPFTP